MLHSSEDTLLTNVPFIMPEYLPIAWVLDLAEVLQSRQSIPKEGKIAACGVVIRSIVGINGSV